MSRSAPWSAYASTNAQVPVVAAGSARPDVGGHGRRAGIVLERAAVRDRDHLIHREHDDDVDALLDFHLFVGTVEHHHDDVGDERDASATDTDRNGILLAVQEHQL